MSAPLSIALLGLALAACGAEPPAPPAPPVAADSTGPAVPPPIDARRARAEVVPVGGGSARGAVTLTEVAGGVRVLAELDGLSEQDFHALHVLRWGDCDATDGPHLGAETGAPHGGPYAPPGLRHAGDLGDVRGDGGSGRYDRVDPVLSLEGPLSAVGRAVVVRAGRDDGVSPDGAAGPAIGCGILEATR